MKAIGRLLCRLGWHRLKPSGIKLGREHIKTCQRCGKHFVWFMFDGYVPVYDFVFDKMKRQNDQGY